MKPKGCATHFMPQPLALVSLLLLHSIHSCVLVEQQTKIASGMEWDNNYDLSGYEEEEGFIFNDGDDAGPLLFPFPVAKDLLQMAPCGFDVTDVHEPEGVLSRN